MGQLIPPLTPEQQPLRHEQKYYISPGDAQYLSLLLRRTMQTDPHANARNEYHIRSLYFDDCFNSAMSDKLDGVMHRHKYRIASTTFPTRSSAWSARASAATTSASFPAPSRATWPSRSSQATPTGWRR